MNSILSILPITLLFLLGLLIKKKGILKQSTIKDLKLIVADFALPALVFKAYLDVIIDSGNIVIVLIMFTIPLIMGLIGKLLYYPLKINSSYFPYLLTGFETGMLGYAIFIAFFGTDQLSSLAIVDLGQGLFVFFVLLPSLKKMIVGKQSLKETTISFIKSPVIIAILGGLTLGSLGFNLESNPLLTSFSGFLDIVGSLTMPLIMISLGYEIEFKKDGFIKAFKTILIRKTILILIAILFNKYIIIGLLKLPEIYTSAAFIVFLMPPPFVISIFMDQDDKDNLGYVTNTLSISIIVSIVLLLFILS
ncbi:permease [Thiospirochaeta perfilievii]|uniref:Permease n=1 Tax=Thiospirochaeta perfilievii TaxID=252967 RepID=A0A5C1QA21_9SPIO|nr:AEC family transporter [Thiospirochaeta perfilievii]QEN03646.1 permease [Thiospirochaeta perfilievii]